MVERSAARLLAQSRSQADIDFLREINERLRALASTGAASVDELARADIAFHTAIYDRCSNELIGSLGRFVTALFAPWIKKSLETGGGLRAAQNHDLLIGMIDLQNPGGASEAAVDRVVEEGLDYWQETLRGLYDKEGRHDVKR
jgi:DNA-binding FadR family transcriptional regulator